MIRMFLLFSLLAAALAAQADCEPAVARAVLDKLQLSLQYDANHHLQGAILRCQPLASDPGQSVLALSRRRPVLGGNGYDIFSLDVVMLRSEDGLILAHYAQPDVFGQQNISVEDISLDMAPYKLSRYVRAFGVRTNYSTLDINGAHFQDLTLFVNNDNTLNMVMTGLLTSENHYDGGYGLRCTSFADDTPPDHLYAGKLLTVDRTVDMAPSQSNGYADMAINETSNETDTRNIDGTCTPSILPPGLASYVLQYDGSHYVVPAKIKRP